MSKSLTNVAAWLILICGALIATEAASEYRPSEVATCDVTDFSRVGKLTYLPRQDSWISKRGDIFRLSECPALKEKLNAGG
jgi:hypothetical protein